MGFDYILNEIIIQDDRHFSYIEIVIQQNLSCGF